MAKHQPTKRICRNGNVDDALIPCDRSTAVRGEEAGFQRVSPGQTPADAIPGDRFAVLDTGAILDIDQLPRRQTDVEFTEKPTGSFAIAGLANTGPCTRWSSSGRGNLDGFASPGAAEPDQFKVRQAVQEFAFKYRGLSIQQEFHRKFIDDRVLGIKNDLTGGYLQAGYFFHNIMPAIPALLEFAARYA